MKDERAELVRIDASGVAHPIGGIASQRLRARTGAYRMLPAPTHVVFMRYTGEDGRRDDEDGAVVRLAGEITAPGALCDVFALLAQTGWRGELVVMDDTRVRSVYFDGGNVVGAQTNVEEERIGRILYKFGVITEQDHARVMERVRAGARYGAAAVELGAVPQERVFQYLGRQIDEVVLSTLLVADGTYFFLDGFDEGRLVAAHIVSANALLMDAVTRMDEMRYFRERVPSSEHVPHRLPAAGEPDPEYAATLAAVDGLRSVAAVGRATGRGEFDTTRDVYALVQSKHLAIHPPRVGGGLESLVEAANEALRRVHAAADAAGRGGELRAALASFAAGAGVHEMVFGGAGPDAGGAFAADRVAERATRVAPGADPEAHLRQLLLDYVGFAVFSVGSTLGAEREGELAREVGPSVAVLRQS